MVLEQQHKSSRFIKKKKKNIKVHESKRILSIKNNETIFQPLPSYLQQRLCKINLF